MSMMAMANLTNITIGGNPWSSYMDNLYINPGALPLGTVMFDELEAKAREKLKDFGGAFEYAGGSAGTGTTYQANIDAFDKWGIVPRMLVDATVRSLNTTIFGVTHSSPVFIAPIGVQAIFHPDAEFNPARAGKALGVPYILSTAASRTIEEAAEANGDGYRWYQLYWPRSNDVTLSLLSRAKAANYSALVVTLDTMNIGWRPHDLDTGFLPFARGVGVQIGFSDPVFMARYGKQPITNEHPAFPYNSTKIDEAAKAGDAKAIQDIFLALEWLNEASSGIFRAWEDLRFLRDNWEGPLVLKGIQRVQDAEMALDFNVDGIVVSNHGGRQLDGAIPTLVALENIMKSPKVQAAQKSGNLTILFDSGIRTGSDIFKALALGAQAVFLGRPWVYGSVVGGQAGVEEVLNYTLADLDSTLGLAGYSSLSEIQGKGEDVIVRMT